MESKINLSTKISGVNLDQCVFNASGCWCTHPKELDELKESSAGAVVSKSSTILERIGNPEPRLHINRYGTINSMGVPNLGYEFYIEYSKTVTNKPFIQSVIPFSIDDMETILYDINKSKNSSNHLVELNLSCPNLVNKSIVAYDFECLDKYLDSLNQYKLDNLKVGLKLPPYYELRTFEEVAKIIKKYPNNINFVTCINSLVNGLLIDSRTCKTRIHPKGGFGGVGGEYCRPTALANVNRFYNLLGDKIDIIGCGGVSMGQHAFEHILSGASAVEVGSQLVKEGPNCFPRIMEELKSIMSDHGYKKIEDFKGKLEIVEENENNKNEPVILAC